MSRLSNHGACPAAPRRKILFGLISAPSAHSYTIEKIGVHIVGVCDSFKVLRTCEMCGKRQTVSFVSYEELYKLGFSKEELQEALRNRL